MGKSVLHIDEISVAVALQHIPEWLTVYPILKSVWLATLCDGSVSCLTPRLHGGIVLAFNCSDDPFKNEPAGGSLAGFYCSSKLRYGRIRRFALTPYTGGTTTSYTN